VKNFIVSGDQHISVKKDIPIAWQLGRYRMLFKSLVALCKEYKADLILAGDLLHQSRPNLHETMLALELFALLDAEGVETHIIAGNHCGLGALGTTLDYFDSVFETSNFITYYPTVDSIFSGNTELVFVGHNQIQNWLDAGDTEWKGTRVVFSHFRPTVNFFIQEEIDVQKFLGTGDHFFLSDIHDNFDLAENAIYTNAPLNNHFEPHPKCGCLLVTLDAGEVSHKRIPLTLPNLIQIDTTAEKFEDTLDTFNFYRISVTGTPEDLRQIKTESPNTKLLKIPELQDTYVESEVVEEVKNQSLQEALVGYMQELNYTEEKIAEMIGVLHE